MSVFGTDGGFNLFCGDQPTFSTDPVELPSDAGAVVRVYPGDVKPSYESGYQFLCQPPRCPMGGQCVRCYADVRSIRIPALIQTFDPETNQSKVDVLMSEIPVGKP